MPNRPQLIPQLARLPIVALLVALAAPASAQFQVSPAGDDANDCLGPETTCRTIQAAVDKAPDGAHVSIAAGTYAEVVSLTDRHRLQLVGEPGAVIAPPAASAGNPVLFEVKRSTGLRFVGLTLAGNGATAQPAWSGFRFFGAEEIEIDGCTVQDLSGGIALHRHSNVQIRDALIRRNRFHGVRVDAGSSVEIAGDPFAAGITVVEDNLFAGVIANRGEVSFLGSVILRGNNYGVVTSGGSVASCCGGSALEITGNRSSGIQMVGGNLELRTPALVAGNGFAGLELYGTTAETGRFSAIEERVVIRENGTATSGAGIVAASASLDLALAEVTANPGHGVLLQDNASLRTYLSAIGGNGGDGVRAETLSTVRLVFDTTVTGNGGDDVVCDQTSVLAGDTTGVGQAKCGSGGRPPRP